MDSPELGDIYKSPKHGRGQIVDARNVRSGKPLWIILYDNGSFGSYYAERIEYEFTYLTTEPLPCGYPKLIKRSPEHFDRVETLKSRGFSHAQSVQRALAEQLPEVKRVDNRPYHVIFVDARFKVIKREVKS